MTIPKLYERVALARDLVDYGLKKGDLATLVDTVPHPENGPVGLILEFSNALGESIRTVVVNSQDIAPLHANEVLAVRELSQAS